MAWTSILADGAGMLLKLCQMAEESKGKPVGVNTAGMRHWPYIRSAMIIS